MKKYSLEVLDKKILGLLNDLNELCTGCDDVNSKTRGTTSFRFLKPDFTYSDPIEINNNDIYVFSSRVDKRAIEKKERM